MSIITHPLLSGKEMGSREWFQAQQQMIRGKPAVKRCYDLWYSLLLADVASVKNEGAIVELGSGSSFIKDLLPEIITSDVVQGPWDMVIDGRKLPFADGSVKALLLTHVFHHIPDIRSFLREATRVLVPGGVIAMIECAHTPVSRAFFGRIHPEPYDHEAKNWDFTCNHNMTDSNQALSWIVFDRDLEVFTREFPDLAYEGREYLPWLGYLLSGGANLRSLVPPQAACLVEMLDSAVKPLDDFGAIHWHMTVRRNGDEHTARRAKLCREALFLYRAFFGGIPPVATLRRYAEAWERHAPEGTSSPDTLSEAILDASVNLEALEYALRLNNPQNLLTKKVKVIHHLAEGEAQAKNGFAPKANTGMQAYLALGSAMVRNAYLLMRGKYLAWRYSVA